METVQCSGTLFFFVKTIMYLANVPEPNIRIGQAWEIASARIPTARSKRDCAAGMRGTVRVFVGERSRNIAMPSPPGGATGGTKWVARPVVGRPGTKEVGVGR